MRMNMIFDGNYLFHKSYSVFSSYHRGENTLKLLEQKKHRDVLIRKCVTDFCYAVNQFSVEIERIIFVIDSHSWRHDFYNDYKYRKTKVVEDGYDNFITALNEFEALLKNKGVIVSRVDRAEGDDLMYVWSLVMDYNNAQSIIVTGDSDIRQLVNENLSVYCNNSKNLNIYCTEENVEKIKSVCNADIRVNSVSSREILVRKVLSGDTSDNIPKIWKGIGEKSLDRFFEKYADEINARNCEGVEHYAKRLAKMFVDFYGDKYSEMLLDDIVAKIRFNLVMVWLCVDVYEETDGGMKLFEAMLENVNNVWNSYRYEKRFTFEDFYGLPIK